jgi:hypothetical protein
MWCVLPTTILETCEADKTWVASTTCERARLRLQHASRHLRPEPTESCPGTRHVCLSYKCAARLGRPLLTKRGVTPMIAGVDGFPPPSVVTEALVSRLPLASSCHAQILKPNPADATQPAALHKPRPACSSTHFLNNAWPPQGWAETGRNHITRPRARLQPGAACRRRVRRQETWAIIFLRHINCCSWCRPRRSGGRYAPPSKQKPCPGGASPRKGHTRTGQARTRGGYGYAYGAQTFNSINEFAHGRRRRRKRAEFARRNLRDHPDGRRTRT